MSESNTEEGEVPVTIYTVGHSTHSYEHFISLLESHGISAIADVRSSPVSRAAPWSDQVDFKRALARNDIAYSFLGKELGGRPIDSSLYTGGVADYEKMARTGLFKEGIQRIVAGSEKYKIALMCAERDPLECHRCLLVGRYLKGMGHNVQHILPDSSLESQEDSENRLLRTQGAMAEQDDMLSSEAELLALAYKKQNKSFAYMER